MVLSPVLRDIFLQLECLVGRIHSAPAAFNLGRNPFWTASQQNSPLSLSDASPLLKSLQLHLCKFVCPSDLSEVFDRLMAICAAVEGTTETAVTPSDAPSKSDRKETVDDKVDNSVSSFIISTLAVILVAVAQLGGVSLSVTNEKGGGVFSALCKTAMEIRRENPFGNEDSPNDPLSMSPSTALTNSVHAITFCFDHLHHSFSPAIRYAAAKSLGVLSNFFLAPICQLFTDKLNSSKGDDKLREFASFQRGVAFLEFGVSTGLQLQTTMGYLTDLVGQMKRIDRGVLRQEICHSLGEVFQRILSPTDPKRAADFHRFVVSNRGVEEFNDVFQKIFERVAKWSSKSAHQMFCWDLLLKMVTLCPDESFVLNSKKKRLDVFPLVVAQLKNKENRGESMAMLRAFIREMPNKWISKDENSKNWWNSQIKLLLNTLIPKGKSSSSKPLASEMGDLIDVTVECGRRSPAFVVTEILADILKNPQSFFTKQRVIAIRSLGIIAKEKKSDGELQNALSPMWGIVTPIVEETKGIADQKDDADEKDAEKYEKSLSLLRASLTCLPHLRPTRPEQLQQMAAFLIQLTLHKDREIAALAAVSVCDIVSMDLNQYLYPSVHALCDLLETLKGIDSLDIVKTVSNVLVVIEVLETHFNVAASAAAANEKSNREGGEGKEEKGETGGEGAEGFGETPGNASPNSASLRHVARAFRVNFDHWITLREHIESSSLVHLAHCEPFVRVEALRLLMKIRQTERLLCDYNDRTLGDSAVKVKSTEVVFPPALIDFVMSPNATESQLNALQMSTESFHSPLKALLTGPHHAKFRGVIASAWGIVSRGVSILSKVGEILDSEGKDGDTLPAEIFHENFINLLNNKILFLCLAVRSPQSLQQSANVPSTTAPPDAQSKFAMQRDRCSRMDFSWGEIQSLFNAAVSFIQSIDTANLNGNLSSLQNFKWKSMESEGTAGGDFASPTVSASNANSLHSLRISVATQLSSVDSTCVTELLKSLRSSLLQIVASANESNGQTKGKRKKGAATVPPDAIGRALYYFHPYTITTLSHLAVRVDFYCYSASSSSWAFDLCNSIDEWVAQLAIDGVSRGEYLSSLNVATRRASAVILQQFIRFRVEAIAQNKGDAIGLSDFLSRRFRWFSLIEILSNSSPLRRQKNHFDGQRRDKKSKETERAKNAMADSEESLDIALLGVLTEMLKCGPIDDFALFTAIQRFIENSCGFDENIQTERIYDAAQLAMRTLIKYNAQRVEEFLKESFPEAHEGRQNGLFAQFAAPEERESALAASRSKSFLLGRLYWTSMVSEWTENFSDWEFFPTGRMATLSLIQQTSADPKCREGALQILTEIAIRSKSSAPSLRNPFPSHPDGNDNFGHFSPSDSAMFVDSAVSVSRSFSLVPEFLSWIRHLFAQSVGAFRVIAANQRQSLLKVIAPWTLQMGNFINSLPHEERPEILNSLLSALLSLSRVAYPNRLLNSEIQTLWTDGFSNGESPWSAEDIDDVAKFFISAYGRLLPNGEQNAPPSPKASAPKMSVVMSPSLSSPSANSRVSIAVATPKTDDLKSFEKSPPGSPEVGAVPSESLPPISPLLDGRHSSSVPPTTSSGKVSAPSSPRSSVLSSPVASSRQSIIGGSPSASSSGPSLSLAVCVAPSTSQTARFAFSIFPVDKTPLPFPSGEIPSALLTVSSEKRLLKVCVFHVSRSAVSSQLLRAFVSHLRNYSPQKSSMSSHSDFLRHLSGLRENECKESPSPSEIAAFDLSAHQIFDRQTSEVFPNFAILLHNAFVLFDEQKDSEAMKTNVALSLSLFDGEGGGDFSIGFPLLSFVKAVRSRSVALRNVWSAVALNWATTAKDPSIRLRSLEVLRALESGEFFFGPQGESLSLLIGICEDAVCRRPMDLPTLSFAVDILSGESEVPMGAAIWKATLSAAFALMKFRHSAVFRGGVRLAVRCVDFKDPSGTVGRVEKLRWAEEIFKEKFVAPNEGNAKEMNDDAAAAIAETLSNGLCNIVLSSNHSAALHVAISLSDLLIDPANSAAKATNRLTQIAAMATLLKTAAFLAQREEDIENAAAAAAKGHSVKAKETADKNEILSVAFLLAEFSLLSWTASLRGEISPAEAERFTTLALLGRNVAVAIANHAKQSEGKGDEQKSSPSHSKGNAKKSFAPVPLRDFDPSGDITSSPPFRRMTASVVRPDGTFNVGGIDGKSLPPLSVFVGIFVTQFASLFGRLGDIHFALKFFSDSIRKSPVGVSAPSRIAAFHAVGKILSAVGGRGQLGIPPSVLHPLSDSLLQSAFSFRPNDKEGSLALSVSSVLVTKRSADDAQTKDPDVFNFFTAKANLQSAGGKAAAAKSKDEYNEADDEADFDRRLSFLQFNGDGHKKFDKIKEDMEGGDYQRETEFKADGRIPQQRKETQRQRAETKEKEIQKENPSNDDKGGRPFVPPAIPISATATNPFDFEGENAEGEGRGEGKEGGEGEGEGEAGEAAEGDFRAKSSSVVKDIPIEESDDEEHPPPPPTDFNYDDPSDDEKGEENAKAENSSSEKEKSKEDDNEIATEEDVPTKEQINKTSTNPFDE